jgi:hypothetical protein
MTVSTRWYNAEQLRRISELTIGITIGWPKPIGTALGTTMSAKTTRRSWMRLRAIHPIPFLIWVVDAAETYGTSDL